MKLNVKALADSYTDNLINLVPISFIYKNSGKESIGLLADNVAEYYPVIASDNDGITCRVNYELLSVLLLHYIKKQQSQITDLEFRIEQLEK